VGHTVLREGRSDRQNDEAGGQGRDLEAHGWSPGKQFRLSFV
jgi:hypothetical protein